MKKTAIYTVLVLFAFMNIYPLIWMFMNSLKSQEDFARSSLALPSKLEWHNYVEAWKTAKFSLYFFNSVFIAVASVAVTVLVGGIAAYFLSRFEFRWKKTIYSFFLFGILIPIHATLVPVYILMNKLNLLNSYTSVIAVYVAFQLSVTVFILVSFMSSLSREVEESAIMDGCGIWRILWKVIWPMSLPAVATVVILNFIYAWNEFVFALVLISNPVLKTVSLGLANFSGEHTTNYTVQMAGLSIALIPVLIVFLLMEKQLVKSMTAGAVKG